MSPALSIRKCSPDELPAVQAYIDRYWRKGHILARDQTFLGWQFSAPGPEPAPQILVLAEDREIMGMQGLIPYPFNLLGRQVPAAWMGNLHCREETRKTGDSLKLMTAVHVQGFAFVCVIGMNEKVSRIYKALRYHMIESLPRVLAVTDRPLALELLSRGLRDGVSEAVIAAQCDRHLVSRERLAQGPFHRCRDWAPAWEAKWDSFWRHSLANTLICTDRGSEYLNWRYRDHQWFKYGMHLAVDPATDGPSGLLVYRIEAIRDSPVSVIRVVELLALDDNAWRTLLSKLLDVAAQSGAAFCDFFCSTPAILRALDGYGMVRCEEVAGTAVFPSRFQPLDFTITKIAGAILPSKETRAILDANWTDRLYVTKSDGDQDRPV